MEVAVVKPPRRRSDPLADLVARERDEPKETSDSWSRPTMASAISIGVHLLLLLFLVLFASPHRRAQLLETVTIEADPNAMLTLFDNIDPGFQTDDMLANTLNEQPLSEAPLKLSPTQDTPSVPALDPGAKLSSAQSDLGARVGSGAVGGVGAAAGSGPPGATGIGPLTAKARRVIFVIDVSSSMKKHNAIEFAKDELIKSIRGLEPNMEFQIVFYNDQVASLPLPDRRRDMIQATETNKENAMRYVRERVIADGGTEHLKGLQRAFDFNPEVIFLMTDADDTAEDIRRLVDQVKRLNRVRISKGDPVNIHVLQLWHDEDKEPVPVIQKLAENNKGSYALIYTYKTARPSDR